MDSIEALPAADSARLAVTLARLASALEPEKGSRFTGLPFAVVSARRVTVDGREILAAHLVRRLNQEATPLEERTLIVAERPSNVAKNEPYTVGYSQRSAGTEDTAEHFDAIAALRGQQSPYLIVTRDQLARTTYDILARAPDGSWRVRWSRALTC